MSWIEVIRIIVAENRQSAVEKQITSMISELNSVESAEAVRLYHKLPGGDLSIYLYWKENTVEPHGSRTGNCLTHLLREFGLVSHSVWVEKDR